MSVDSVQIVPSGRVAAEDKADKSLPPKEYHRQPLAVLVPILHETDVPISSPDTEVARRRGIPVNEAIRSGLAVVGAEGGETWHTHPDFVDTILYVVSGTASFWWRNDDGGDERQQDVGPGDFVFIHPRSTHQWLNTGPGDLTFAFFQHSHEYGADAAS